MTAALEPEAVEEAEREVDLDVEDDDETRLADATNEVGTTDWKDVTTANAGRRRTRANNFAGAAATIMVTHSHC
jgi:hypothetical protein